MQRMEGQTARCVAGKKNNSDGGGRLMQLAVLLFKPRPLQRFKFSCSMHWPNTWAATWFITHARKCLRLSVAKLLGLDRMADLGRVGFRRLIVHSCRRLAGKTRKHGLQTVICELQLKWQPHTCQIDKCERTQKN